MIEQHGWFSTITFDQFLSESASIGPLVNVNVNGSIVGFVNFHIEPRRLDVEHALLPLATRDDRQTAHERNDADHCKQFVERMISHR
jgi:hypothetical protein